MNIKNFTNNGTVNEVHDSVVAISPQGQQIQQGVARHQNVQIFDELVLAAKAQQTLHVQCQACVALLRGQGCNVKFILCHDYPPVTVYAV